MYQNFFLSHYNYLTAIFYNVYIHVHIITGRIIDVDIHLVTTLIAACNCEYKRLIYFYVLRYIRARTSFSIDAAYTANHLILFEQLIGSKSLSVSPLI